MNQRIIGIDLALNATHKAMILDPACNQFIGSQITFRARPEDLERLWQRARQGAGDDVEVIVVMEATGMAWYPVGVYLQRQGAVVFRVNGQKTKDFRRFLSKHAGSDQIDSCLLARLYLIAPERLERCPLVGGDELTLQRACRAYAHWREQDVAQQNRMKAMDHWAWDGLQKLVPTAAQTWMRQYWYNPWRVQEAGEAHLITAWKAVAPADEESHEWVGRWVRRAQQMTAVYGSEEMVGYDALQAYMVYSLQLRALYAEKQAILMKTQIQPLYQQLYPDCPLTTILGIGVQSAAFYRAFIQNINRFPTIEQFRCWCGIIPRSQQSGDGESKGLRITQAGPDLIKATLYLNAEVARQRDVQLAFLYHTQMVVYGKHHTQAVCACASHLASRIYAVLKENRPYQLRDLQGNPITKEESRELALQYRVPDDVRQRNTKRFRQSLAEQKKEENMQRKQKAAK
jgi:transposase